MIILNLDSFRKQSQNQARKHKGDRIWHFSGFGLKEMGECLGISKEEVLSLVRKGDLFPLEITQKGITQYEDQESIDVFLAHVNNSKTD